MTVQEAIDAVPLRNTCRTVIRVPPGVNWLRGSLRLGPFGSGQAVAIRVTADWYAFYNCLFIGWQYLKDCYIDGCVDFIFGNSTALLEHCHIQCKSAGLLIAQSIKSSQESTGYVFPRVVWLGDPVLVLLALFLVMIQKGALAIMPTKGLEDTIFCIETISFSKKHEQTVENQASSQQIMREWK
ncbi:hypothetical protein NC651_037015 [Populus alba x Populus x berolinensis]|nr:hypothetical protein NC651_037015 [Populus alba x Populus x berolinensis]